MRRPWQIWGALGGGKHPQIWLKMAVFWLKHVNLTLWLHKQVYLLRFDSGGGIGKIWSPQGPSWSSIGGPGGQKTPPNLTQNGRFWLKHDNLTLWLYKQVNLILFDSGGSIRENLEPTGAILVRYWGRWGAENTPKYDSKWPFFG